MIKKTLSNLLLSFGLAIAAAMPAAAADAPPLRSKPQATDVNRHLGPYTYDASGNITSIGSDIGTESYRYDLFGRLVRAQVASPTAITQQYDYDSFGNMTAMHNTPGVDVTLPILATTNRFPPRPTNVAEEAWPSAYDESGNQTKANLVYTFKYDGAAMVKALDGPSDRHERYVYDADDERIATVTGAPNSVTWRYTARDLGARFVREYTDMVVGTTHTWNWTRDYAYAGDKLVGTIIATGTTEQRLNFHFDHLGTPWLITSADGTLLSRQKLLPFGEEAPGSVTDESQRVRFTGHERDYAPSTDENDLDYMHARYYAPKMGRFLSVDPVLDVTKASPEVQRWNRYAYTVNDPVRYADPDGREHVQEPGFTKPMTRENLDLANAPSVIRWTFNVQGALMTASAADMLGAGELVSAVRNVYNLARRLGTSRARKVADEAQEAGRKRGAAASLRTRDGQTFNATSGSNNSIHPDVQEALDSVPESEQPGFHTKCAEPACISKALDAGADPRGGDMQIVRIRPLNHPGHGTPIGPCTSCQRVLDWFGIPW